MSASSTRSSRWLRFNLRTLLILGPLLAVVLGLGFRAWYPRYLERRAVEEIERLEGTMARNDAGQIITVELPGKGIDNAKLRLLVPHLKNLPQLRDLVLVSNEVGDEGLLLLAELPQLQYVYVADTKVTDAGIAKLQGLRPKLTVDRTSPHIKAMTLAARSIYNHAILSLAFAEREGMLLGGGGDGRLRIWDLASGEMVASHPVHDEWTFAVALHPSGESLATAGGDDLIKLWSWPELREIGRFTGHDDDVHAIGFTPDGRRLVSAGDDMTVRIWDVDSRRQLHRFEGHEGTIPGLAISPDGRLAATASRDETVRLWSIERGECLGVLTGHRGDVMSVAFHPSGNELASGSYDGTVRRWDLSPWAGRETRAAPAAEIVAMQGHSDWVFSVAYSPTGDELISTAGDGVRAWDRESGRLLWQSNEQRNVARALWLSDTDLATASADASIALWSGLSGDRAGTLWTRFAPDVTAGRKLTAE